MGKRGPSPSSKLTVINKVARKKPSVPAGMSKRAGALFKKIVSENKVDAFDSESVALLRAFCEADNQHFEATTVLEDESAVVEVVTRTGVVPRRNPWFDVQKESAAVMNSISTKLRKKGVNVDKEEKPKSKREGLMFNGQG